MSNLWRVALCLLVTVVGLAACRPPSYVPPVIPSLAVRPTTGPRTPTLAPITPVRPGDTPTPPEATPAPPEAAFTPTPTARPGLDPTLDPATPDPNTTLVTAVPPPMPQLFLDRDVVNILLVGRDTPKGSASYRTDVLIVASLDKARGTVMLLSLPRDLFVYIPGWTMNRINTAAQRGDSVGYPGGGMALLGQTILYNLGIPIHGWARIDFDGFKQVIDTLGGVNVPVTCAMQDWRLKDPALDAQNPDNWELYTVQPGVVSMDGDLALWYARSRKRSSDYDRSRRQQIVLRAVFDQALNLNLLPKAPQLYQQGLAMLDTDLTVGDVLQFVPMAVTLDRARIYSRFLNRNHVWSWTTPAGAAVLLPDRAAITTLLAEAFAPQTVSAAASAPLVAVQVVNASGNPAFSALASENLRWAGLAAQPAGEAAPQPATTLYDFSAEGNAERRAAVAAALNLPVNVVVAQPDPAAAAPFRVVLGADYNPCVQPPQVIRPTPTPEPQASGPILPAEIVRAVRIPPQAQPPTVDGDLAEWTVLPYDVRHVSAGAGNFTGAADLSARWMLAWNEQYLYLAVRVTDDSFVQAARGEALFKGDSLEVRLRLDPGSADPRLTGRDFQLGLSPGDLAGGAFGPEAFRWLPEAQKQPIDDVRLAGRLTADGYTLEAALPWGALGTTAFAGEGFGFSLALNDNDVPNTQGQQTQLTHTANVRLDTPITWGVLTLEP